MILFYCLQLIESCVFVRYLVSTATEGQRVGDHLGVVYQKFCLTPQILEQHQQQQ